tara:strand:+ start:695 stop:910 length:216 start_codon:yes stop_codon:yes gene_type:complete
MSILTETSKGDVMSIQEETVKDLLKKARDTKSSLEALQFTQAAVNAANTKNALRDWSGQLAKVSKTILSRP